VTPAFERLADASGRAETGELHAAKQRWRDQRARDYNYVIAVNCFCFVTGPVKIRVVNRRARGTPEGFRNVDTGKELFQLARRAIDGAGQHSVRYRPRLGLPRSISDDPIPHAVDDEYSYQITKLRITRRYRSR
jgi:hypothetical protein